MKKILSALVLASAVLFGAAFVLAPEASYAQTRDSVCEGIGLATGSNGCQDDGDDPSVNDTIGTVIDLLSVVVGVVAVVMIIVGGLKYITSGGDAGKTASAKNTILYALVGLVIVLIAQSIVFFVIDRAIGSDNSSGSGQTTNLCRPDGTSPDPTRQCAR